MNIFYILGGAIVNFIVLLILAARYKLLLAFLTEKISLFKSLSAVCASYALNYISPFKIDAFLAKPFATKLFTKGSFQKPLAALSFEFIVDLASQVLLFLLSAAAASQGLIHARPMTQTIVFISATSVGLLVITFFRKRILNAVWGLLPKRIRKTGGAEHYAQKLLNDIKAIFSNKRLLLKVILLTTMHIFLVPLMVYASAKSLSVDLSYGFAFTAYWLSFMVGRLSGLPGGIGTRDVTLMGLLALNGVPPATALKIALVYRLVAILPNLILGIPTLIYLGGHSFKLGLIAHLADARDVRACPRPEHAHTGTHAENKSASKV